MSFLSIAAVMKIQQLENIVATSSLLRVAANKIFFLLVISDSYTILL